MPENSDLNLLINAARASGDIACKFWQKSPETWDKSAGAGPVTEADLAIDKMLHHELLSARPDYGWLSEETEDSPDRLSHDHVFIIDPIDGTRGFIEGSTAFAHSLAIAHKGKITAAVVFLPMLDKLYTATDNTTTTLNEDTIEVSQPNPDQIPTLLTPKRNFKPEYWRDHEPAFTRHHRPSIAYRMCLVAQGRFDAMLTLRPTWEWDVAAGTLIAQRAKATTTDKRGTALTFNSPQAKFNGIISAAPALHKTIQNGLT